MFIFYLTKQIKNPQSHNQFLKPLQNFFQALCKQAKNALPSNYSDLGELVSIDGALIDAVLSMHWADYRKGAKKAKGQTGIMDRGYQSHKDFDLLQDEKKHFVATDHYNLTADQVATV